WMGIGSDFFEFFVSAQPYVPQTARLIIFPWRPAKRLSQCGVKTAWIIMRPCSTAYPVSIIAIMYLL
ncbi:MAG: hypothetical protein AABZ67_05890, partial [Pseudomonadota bacterium]